MTTTLAPEKVTRQVEVGWAEGGRLRGYEIHHGQTQAGTRARPYLNDGLGFQQDNVWGVNVHGLFENAEFRQRLLVRLGCRGRLVSGRARWMRSVTEWLVSLRCRFGVAFCSSSRLRPFEIYGDALGTTKRFYQRREGSVPRLRLRFRLSDAFS